MPVNTKYPNLPENFRIEVRKARLAKGLSLRAAAKKLGLPNAASLSQLELGQRNFTYSRAVHIRNFFNMDFELPDVDFTNAMPVIRNRFKRELKKGPLFVEINGRLIKVMTYYEMGDVVKGEILTRECKKG